MINKYKKYPIRDNNSSIFAASKSKKHMDIYHLHLWDLNWNKFGCFKYYVKEGDKNDLKNMISTLRKVQSAGGGGFAILEKNDTLFVGYFQKGKEKWQSPVTRDFIECWKMLNNKYNKT